MNTASLDDFKYALGFVDNFRRLAAVYLQITRAEVGTELLRFIAELGKPRKVVTDNAKMFKFEISRTFVYSKKFVKNLFVNTLHKKTVKKRFAEPSGRWLGVCWKQQAYVNFLSFAYRACFHCANGTTPFEKIFHKTPDVSHFRVFRCQAFMNLEEPKRS